MGSQGPFSLGMARRKATNLDGTRRTASRDRRAPASSPLRGEILKYQTRRTIRCRLQKTCRGAPRMEAEWAGACGKRIREVFAGSEEFCIIGMTVAPTHPA